MFTPEQVLKLLPQNFQYLAEYATQIANLYVLADADYEEYAQLAIGDAAFLAASPTPEAYRDAYIGACEGYDLSPAVGLQVKALQIPQAIVAVNQPRPINYYGRHNADIRRLRKIRVGTRWRRRALARAAADMEDWFHWVQSGPRQPDRSGQRGDLYGPKTSWTKTYTAGGYVVEKHDRKFNDFAAWVSGQGAEPDQASCMNCWEAVLFSAYQAALVDKTWLTTIHRKASLAFELEHKHGDSPQTADQHYGFALSQAFLFSSSVPFEPRAGLIPCQGDIMFFDRNEHVTISLGPTWDDNGERDDWMMSLWGAHNDGRFVRLRLAEFPSHMQSALRFRPCPFPY